MDKHSWRIRLVEKIRLQQSWTLQKPPNIKPNSIANRIINLTRVPLNKAHSKVARSKILRVKKNAEPKSEYAWDFTTEVIITAIKSLKLDKAAGTD